MELKAQKNTTYGEGRNKSVNTYISTNHVSFRLAWMIKRHKAIYFLQ